MTKRRDVCNESGKKKESTSEWGGEKRGEREVRGIRRGQLQRVHRDGQPTQLTTRKESNEKGWWDTTVARGELTRAKPRDSAT